MLKKYPTALYLTWAVILIVLPIPLVQLLNIAVGSIFIRQQLFMVDLGVIAYTWWLSVVFLSTRPVWLDKMIGLPKMYFIHGMVGVLALILAFFHRQNLTSMSSDVRLTGNWAFYLVVFGMIYAVIFMSGWLVDHFKIAYDLKNKLQYILKHQMSVWIHRLNLIAILLIWMHVHLIFQINTRLEFMILFDTYSLATFGAYFYNKFVTSDMKSSGVVIENKKLSTRANQITIKLDDLKIVPQPGDTYFLSFRGVSGISREAHPFSIKNVPDENNLLTFAIQKGGDFTKKLDLVNANSKVRVEGPFGNLNKIANQKTDPLILLGMGTGTSPLISMIEGLKVDRPVHILWSVSDSSQAYYQNEIESLNIESDIKIGRFDRDYLQEHLTQREIDTGDFITVGSAQGVLNIEKMLKENNVDNQRIFDERLTM